MTSAEGPLVLKFGGTSLGSADFIRRVVDIVARSVGSRVVVVSAVGSTTDRLARIADLVDSGDLGSALVHLNAVCLEHRRLAEELLSESRGLARCFEARAGRIEAIVRAGVEKGELSREARVRVLGEGEEWSSRLVAAVLVDSGSTVRRVAAHRVIRAEERLPIARPARRATESAVRRVLTPLLQKGAVAVIPGYLARTRGGRSTTLGRGGSDLTASLLGAALRAREIQIWTDVDGIWTADPRIVKGARPLRELGDRFAADLARSGARVLHPATLDPAMRAGIPVRVKDTERPEDPGTLVLPGRSRDASAVSVSLCPRIAIATWERRDGGPVAPNLGRLLAYFEERGRAPLGLRADPSAATLVLPGVGDCVEVAEGLPSWTLRHVEEGRCLVTVVRDAVEGAERGDDLEMWRARHEATVVTRDPRGRWSSYALPADRGRDAVREAHALLVEAAG